MRLPDHNRTTQTMPDAMHIIKDKLVYTIIGVQSFYFAMYPGTWEAREAIQDQGCASRSREGFVCIMDLHGKSLRQSWNLQRPDFKLPPPSRCITKLTFFLIHHILSPMTGNR